ncbi:GNAT family acetyltransferase [Rummeliibacillus stabekisii]|uniref:GNAT family acetyltransferase n=1 Tax=Rummeliibacillus stabekisii TaxID=241244 RepID=A0A143HAB6_9BACL|nr:GNAT family acetyltransferase [Rummeliibacillus stabekisii]AMW98466.1 GNAT family acetyltransferase [Rummeliibacillus stabekisii]
MALDIVQLRDFLNTGRSEEEIRQILLSFCSRPCSDPEKINDVEYFLHSKAIEFEKMDISRTYLVFSTYKDIPVLVGYYSLSNKPLVISKKNFAKFPNSLKRKLMGFGHKTDSDNYEIKGYLLGQIGKSFAKNALATNSVNGADLLKMATDSMMNAYRATGGRIFYLECEDEAKLKSFYTSQGFREIEHYKSQNDLCIFIRKIEEEKNKKTP